MNEPISSYADLTAALAAMPPAPPDTVRVYRGQTKDYPKLQPSGLRTPVRNQAIWLAYSAHLYHSLLTEFKNAGNDVTAELLSAYQIWFHALAQHYGPGSDFLDVTYSLDVALWFALHDTETMPFQGVIGPPGPPDPRLDHPTSGKALGYKPRTEPGVLYVFDLPKWDGKGTVQAGMVVDLADAPPIFSSSARMRAQKGCLVYCRNKDSSPFDMRAHLLQDPPLQVIRPMSGASGLDRPVADVFPSPEQDEWYARLLSVPMNYAPQPTPPTLQRSIPVTVYFDRQNDRYNNEVHFRDVVFQPPLMHRVFRGFERADGNAAPQGVPAGATPVILEAPMVFPFPPGDSDLWHQGLLASDVPDRCPVYQFGNLEPCGEVPLTNVLFEFSLLEQVGWDRIVKNKAPVQLERGVWLRRQGDNFEAAMVSQEMPGHLPAVSGFLPFRYDPGLGQFVFLSQPNQPGIPVVAEPTLAKPIFIALMLLRHLSPALKAAPTPGFAFSSATETGQPQTTFLLRCARDAARLFRVSATPPNSDWFVLRDTAKPEEPFTHPSRFEGALKFESSGPFNQISTDEIRNAIHA